MRFTVIWDPDAEEHLARMWLGSRARESIRLASDAIERSLRVDAHLKGVPLERRRVFSVDPLAVVYTVSLDDRIVTSWRFASTDGRLPVVIRSPDRHTTFGSQPGS